MKIVWGILLAANAFFAVGNLAVYFGDNGQVDNLIIGILNAVAAGACAVALSNDD